MAPCHLVEFVQIYEHEHISRMVKTRDIFYQHISSATIYHLAKQVIFSLIYDLNADKNITVILKVERLSQVRFFAFLNDKK